MSEIKTNKDFINYKTFTILYDYYTYLFQLPSQNSNQYFFQKFNVLNLFSDKYSSDYKKKSILTESISNLIYMSFFNQLDLIKMKFSSLGNSKRINDIFNEIIFEKKAILLKNRGGGDIGVLQTFFRLTYSKGVFIPSSWLFFSSFYLQYNLNYNENFNNYKEMTKICLIFFSTCILSIPFKNLQFETTNKMSSESVLVKDFFRLFNIRNIMSGFLLKYDFNVLNCLPYLIFENFIGLMTFFKIYNYIGSNDYFISFIKNPDSESLFSNNDLLNEISELNSTIRRSLKIYQKEDELRKKKLSLVSF